MSGVASTGGLTQQSRADRSSRAAASRLYAANLGLAGLVLSRFASLPWEAREDAYGAALVGLWAACQRFDGVRGFTFSTFAARCIRNAVLNHLQHRRQQEQIPVVSLETPIGGNGLGEGESDLADLIADPQAEEPGAALLNRAGFDALLASLPVRQQEVLRAVYEQDRPLSEIAVDLGVTKQRAGQIHLQALVAIRKSGEEVRTRARGNLDFFQLTTKAHAPRAHGREENTLSAQSILEDKQFFEDENTRTGTSILEDKQKILQALTVF